MANVVKFMHTSTLKTGQKLCRIVVGCAGYYMHKLLLMGEFRGFIVNKGSFLFDILQHIVDLKHAHRW